MFTRVETFLSAKGKAPPKRSARIAKKEKENEEERHFVELDGGVHGKVTWTTTKGCVATDKLNQIVEQACKSSDQGELLHACESLDRDNDMTQLPRRLARMVLVSLREKCLNGTITMLM